MIHSPTVMPAHNLALEKLLNGNRRYQVAKQTHSHQTAARRHDLLDDQKPFSCILSCADSRVPPELIFDQGLGDLFVIRVAGHVIDASVLASTEFAVAMLGVPLVMVLGHSQCGAVEATVRGGELPDSLSTIVAAIQPAVTLAKEMPGELVDNAIKINTRMTAVQLLTRSSLLGQAATNEQVKIVAAIYDLYSGSIEILT